MPADWVLGVRVSGTCFGAWRLGISVLGLGFGVWGLGFGVYGLGFEIWGAAYRCAAADVGVAQEIEDRHADCAPCGSVRQQ